MGKKRFTVEITEDQAEKLLRVARRKGHSQADLVRRAIALMMLAAKAEEDGKTLSITDGEKIEKDLILL